MGGLNVKWVVWTVELPMAVCKLLRTPRRGLKEARAGTGRKGP